MDLAFSTLNLADLKLLLSKSNCSCHFINPNKTRIILWKEVKDGVTTYYLKIGIQKFISYPLSDKNQEVYWRFKDYAKVEKADEVSPAKPGVSTSELSLKEPKEAKLEPDPITKFQQRQAKTETLNNHGAATNHPEQSVPTSH